MTEKCIHCGSDKILTVMHNKLNRECSTAFGDRMCEDYFPKEFFVNPVELEKEYRDRDDNIYLCLKCGRVQRPFPVADDELNEIVSEENEWYEWYE